MNILKRQINELEDEIVREKTDIAEKLEVLKTDMKSPVFLISALVGGVALGFLLGDKRTTRFIRENAAKTPSLVKGSLKHIGTVLPLLTRIFL